MFLKFDIFDPFTPFSDKYDTQVSIWKEKIGKTFREYVTPFMLVQLKKTVSVDFIL